MGPKGEAGWGQNESLGLGVGVGVRANAQRGASRPLPLCTRAPLQMAHPPPPKHGSSPSAVAMSLNLNGSSSPISLFSGQQALLWGQRAACAPPVQREGTRTLRTCRHVKTQPGAPAVPALGPEQPLG